MLQGKPFGQRFVNPMTFSEWCEVHEDRIKEERLNGMTDNELEMMYSKYVTNR
jgi:hypothetical protein